jgi:hypothetical protein
MLFGIAHQRDPFCGESEEIVFMAIFILLLLPVLIPATITAFHALAGCRRRPTLSPEPIPASA